MRSSLAVPMVTAHRVRSTIWSRSHTNTQWGVSKELRSGIRESIEILANEVIAQRLTNNKAVYEGPNRVDAKVLTTQCLAVSVPVVGVALCRVSSRAGHRARQR
jgi:hypothetical protein